MADERDFFRAALVVRGREVAAEDGCHAKDFEEFVGDVGPGVAVGIAVDGGVDGRAVDIRGEQVERLLALAHRLVVEQEDLAAEAVLVGVLLRDIDHLDAGQPRGIGEREAAEHRAVDDAEHRRDAADAEGEDQHGERAETFLFDEDAQADAHVLEETFDQHGDGGLKQRGRAGRARKVAGRMPAPRRGHYALPARELKFSLATRVQRSAAKSKPHCPASGTGRRKPVWMV